MMSRYAGRATKFYSGLSAGWKATAKGAGIGAGYGLLFGDSMFSGALYGAALGGGGYHGYGAWKEGGGLFGSSIGRKLCGRNLSTANAVTKTGRRSRIIKGAAFTAMPGSGRPKIIKSATAYGSVVNRPSMRHFAARRGRYMPASYRM
jgi:hypothetical protein